MRTLAQLHLLKTPSKSKEKPKAHKDTHED